MSTKDSPEELPAGWTVLSKVLRTGRNATIYTNVESGKRFFSKADLFKYIKAGSNQADKPPPHNKDSERHVESTSPQISHETISRPLVVDEDCKTQEESTSLQPEPVNEKDERPKWLPDGWEVEVRTRKSGLLNGKEYKCYIDPLNRCKFYSKVEVNRYLETIKRKNGTRNDVIVNHENRILEKKTNTSEKKTKKNNILEKKTDTSMNSINKVVVQKSEAVDLPSGWIKEIKIRQTSSNVIRKDPFYTDPVSGYVFRSKKDALRYVQTGEISRHAFKPKKPSGDTPESMKDEISTSSAAKKQKLKHPPNRPQVFSGKKGSEASNLEQSKTEGSKILSAKVSLEAGVTISSRDDKVGGKHSLDDTTQVCVQSKKQCPPNISLLAKEKDEASKQGENTRLTLSGAAKKNRGKRNIAENGPVSTPAPEFTQDKKIVETVTASVSGREGQVNSRKSTGKKIHSLPPRSSKRLAGHEPDKVANLELGERAFISSIRQSKKTETVQDTHLTSDDLVDQPSAQVELRSAEYAHHSSSKTNNIVDKSPIKRTEPLEDQVAPEELYHELENDNSEPQLSFLFGSDPCLEFAFKTLMGELPLDDTSVNGPTPLYTGGTVQPEHLLGTETKKSSTQKGHAGRSKSRNKKELNLPRRSSKRLARSEPELVLNSVSLASESVQQNSTTEPFGQGSISGTDSLDKTHNGPGTMAELANQLFTNSAERSSIRDRSFENAAAEQPKMHGKVQLEKPEITPLMHETGKVEIEEQEPDLSFSIADYWSDPCLDFAFKTLTGAIPIEDSLVQSYFQEQVDLSNNLKNGSTTLPDFGSSSLFQADISPHFDEPEKSSMGQQGSVTPPFLSTSNVSFSSCSGVHSQQQSIEGNNDLHQKVNS